MSKTVVIRHQGAVSTSQRGALVTPTDLSRTATQDISGAMNAILADVFASYLKTKTSTGTSVAHTFETITCYSTSRASRFSR